MKDVHNTFPNINATKNSFFFRSVLTPFTVTKSAMTKVLYENEAVSARLVATTPGGEWGNVDDVAKGAVFLASDDAAWVTGFPLPVDGGYLAQ